MIGQGDSRTRFFVCYGYCVAAALIVLSHSLLEQVRGEGAEQWLVPIAAALVVALVPSWVARYLPGPIWLTPVVIGIGAGVAMFPALAFTFVALSNIGA
jgi:hypothetical protein